LGKLVSKTLRQSQFCLANIFATGYFVFLKTSGHSSEPEILRWPQGSRHILYDFGKSGTPEHLIEATAIFDTYLGIITL